MQFEGTFRPPGIGATTRPMPIAGPGRCEVTEDGLEVHGFQPPGSGRVVLSFLLAAVAAGAAAWFVTWLFFPDSGTNVTVIAVAAIASGVGVAAVGSGRHRESRPIEWSIPWSSIAKVGLDVRQRGVVMVHVKRFQPKGAIHFEPEVGTQEFIEAVEARRPS